MFIAATIALKWFDIKVFFAFGFRNGKASGNLKKTMLVNKWMCL